jgi:hypothetical protein
MSRRTKLTLAASTALVLLLVLAFAAFSWTAENPLRFRVVAQGPVELAKKNMMFVHEGEPVIPYEIEVTNTKPYAIHLRDVTFFTQLLDLAPESGTSPPESRVHVHAPIAVGYLRGVSRNRGIAIHMPEAVVPESALSAHGARRHRILMRERTARRLDWSKVRSEYYWESWSKCWLGKLLDRARYALQPSSMADHIPVAEEDLDEAILDDALPKP